MKKNIEVWEKDKTVLELDAINSERLMFIAVSLEQGVEQLSFESTDNGTMFEMDTIGFDMKLICHKIPCDDELLDDNFLLINKEGFRMQLAIDGTFKMVYDEEDKSLIIYNDAYV